MENIQISSTEDSSYNLSDSPSFSFNGELLNLLPDFYAEKIIGTEQYRFLKLITQQEGIFNTIYSNIKEFYNTLDINKTSPKYLYLLGILLGQEVEDLTHSLDEEKIKKQREFLRQTIDRLLIKGTPESIIRFYYGLGIFLDIEELWTYDFNSFTIHSNRFIKDFIVSQIKYNQGITDPLSANYTSVIYEDWDILSSLNQSLSGSIGTQNITKINKLEMNNYNYSAITAELSGSTVLYIKDDSNNWLKYDSNTNIIDFKFYDDIILILQESISNPVLKIYKFSNILLGKEKKIITDINYFSFINSNNVDYLLVDIIIGNTSQIQLRNFLDFSVVNYITKPIVEPITKVLNLKDNEWILFDELNKKYFFLTKNEEILTLPLVTQNYLDYSTIFPISGNIYINKRMTENMITMLSLDPNSPEKRILRRDITFIDYVPYINIPVPYISTLLSDLQDIVFLDEKSFLFLGKNGLGIYFFEYLNAVHDFIFVEILDFGDNSNHWKFIINETLSNIYISKNDNFGKYSLIDFIGMYFYGRATLFKTHYYNFKISKDLSFTSDTTILQDLINNNLKYNEIAYSKLRNINFSEPAAPITYSLGYGIDGFGVSYGGKTVTV